MVNAYFLVSWAPTGSSSDIRYMIDLTKVWKIWIFWTSTQRNQYLANKISGSMDPQKTDPFLVYSGLPFLDGFWWIQIDSDGFRFIKMDSDWFKRGPDGDEERAGCPWQMSFSLISPSFFPLFLFLFPSISFPFSSFSLPFSSFSLKRSGHRWRAGCPCQMD